MKMKIQSNRCERKSNEKSLKSIEKIKVKQKHLFNLPDEILEQILSFCDENDRKYLSRTSTRLSRVILQYEKHKYRKTISSIYENESRMVLKRIGIAIDALQAVEVPLKFSSFEASFYSFLNDFFNISSSKMLTFSHLMNSLEKFYKVHYNQSSIVSILIVTLLLTLNRFQNACSSCEYVSTSQLTICYEIKRIWIAILWKNIDKNLNESKDDLRSLVVIIIVLLINSKINEKFYKITDFGLKVWVFGNEFAKISSRQREASVTLDINVFTCIEMLEVFKGIVDGNQFSGNIANNLNKIEIGIYINCKEANLWGCPTDIHIQL